MEFYYGDGPVADKSATARGITIYDTERKTFRLSIWEEDGVLRVYQSEAVVLVTAEDDLRAARKDID